MKFKMKSYLFALIGGLAVAGTAVAETQSNPYYEISQIEWREIPEESGVLPKEVNPGNFSDCSGPPRPDVVPNQPDLPPLVGGEAPWWDILDVIVDRIINIGRKVWAIVEAGRPVVNVKLDKAHAMPAGLYCWSDLAGWQMPQSKTYQATYLNGYGSRVVDFKYRVIYTHGGNHRGVGQYIANATIMPVKIDVAWGFAFDAAVEVPLVFNMGTVDQPLAGMQMDIKWSVKTVVKHMEQVENFAITGDGQFRKLD